MDISAEQRRSSLTVREVLAMSSVQNGEPELVTGEIGLDAAVRWVHIAAGSGVASLLEGGELILTTGAGWPKDAAALEDEIKSLLRAGIAGLFLELGARFTSIPQPIVDLCRAAKVALVALTIETPFVQITEQVHRSILQEQAEALTARDEVQAMLTKLGLNRAPVDYVVEQLASVLNAPVVFENTLGEVMSWADPNSASDARTVLAAWPRNAAEPLPPGWNAVRVEAKDARWGQLIALTGPAHPAGRQTVLELGAIALALGRLVDPLAHTGQSINSGAKRLIEDLLQGTYRSDADIEAQLTAAGLGFAGQTLYAFSMRIPASSGGRRADESNAITAALQRTVATQGRVLFAFREGADTSLLGILAVNTDALSTGGVEAMLSSQLDEQLRSILSPPTSAVTSNPHWRVLVTLAPGAADVGELVSALEMANATKTFVSTRSGERVALAVIAKQPLSYLVSELKSDVRLDRFAHSVLEPLIEYDRKNGTDLLRVLDAYVRHPTNRSRAAQAANLSRSVFYQRIDLIEAILETDLTDGTVIATLYLALETASHLVRNA